MGLKSFLLETANSPRRCFVLMTVILCLTALSLWDGGSSNLKTDGPIIRLDSKAILRQRFDEDPITTTISPGDSVRVLAIDRSSSGQNWLVKTSNGDIGWIDAAEITGIRQIVTDGANKGDTVSIKAVWSSTGKYVEYYSFTKNGEDIKRSTHDFIPDLEGWEKLQYNRAARAGVCSQGKFRKKTQGKSFEEINISFGTPVLLHFSPDTFMAQYSWKVYDPKSGEMYIPNIAFDSDSVVTSVTFVNPTDRAASWLKHMPLAENIIDNPWTSFYIRGSRYQLDPSPMVSGFVKFLVICLLILVFIVYFCWTFAMQTVPVLLMGWLMKFPIVFKPLSDQVLRLLMFIVMLVCVYIQSVVMMAWGMFPFWSIVILIMSWYTFSLAQSPLCTYPHIRCPHCRRLFTIKFDHQDFEYSEIKTGSDIVRGKLLGTYKEEWKKWTEVTTTTTYGDGHVTSDTRRQNVRNMARNINVYQYIDYEVKYRLDHYRNYYICSECGFVEETTPVKYTELERKAVGSHTGEVRGDEYETGW